MDKMERMQMLVKKLGDASYMYEQQNTEIMSNLEYDKLYDELAQLEKELGVVLAGSVTQKVGYQVVTGLNKETHATPMLSLDKTKELSKLQSFLEAGDGVLSWKLDGLTVVCTYNEGVLEKAITRGNGTVGEDVTNNAKTFKNLPLTIPFDGMLVVRGEAIITYSDFEKINERLEDREKYKNPRNLCSGSVRQLDSEETAKRNVQFMAFSIIDCTKQFDYKSESLIWLKQLGFDVVEHTKVTKGTIEKTVAQYEQSIKDIDFGSDGLVLTYDNIEFSEGLGSTSKFPKDSLAFKWKDELKETTIKYIEWSTSRTGLINPVAVFEAVDLEGTSVERASVHNISILEELELGVGDTVTVYKANMIIPQIAENLTKSGMVELPKTCAVCGANTEIKKDKNTKQLFCPNSNCEAQQVKLFTHFVSRNAMNIDGLSEATIEKFVTQGFLVDLSSLYELEQYEDQIIALDGFGKRSYNKLIKSINNSKNSHLYQFIYALGILQVGTSNAKLICKHFKNDLSQIRQATAEQLVEIEGVGPIIAKEISDYFSIEKNNQILDKLLGQIKFIQEEVIEEETAISGKVFVITGDVHHFENRKALQAELEKRGAKVTGSVSKKTNYLINNDATSSSSKNQKANELGIPILTEDALLKMLEL
ncbi:MAG: DNA ligase (NAD(+)) LigA [Epulopiscium sp. Nele67-Bin004]|nr:MAG: DNA ligase (NAD(+)) LigA [Epulopiscium sp. Nele67-Bin004]